MSALCTYEVSQSNPALASVYNYIPEQNILGHIFVELLPEVLLVAGVVEEQDLLQEMRRGPLHDGVHGADQGGPGGQFELLDFCIPLRLLSKL